MGKSLFVLFLFVALLGDIFCVLQQQFLTGQHTVCNDGSPATYYIRATTNTTWIIYLMGGGYCFDANTCAQRWKEAPSLMSSKGYPTALTGTGIYSEDPKINPVFSTANLVFVPYCSSDVWTGNHTSTGQNGDWHFHGAAIVRGLVDDLVAKFSFRSAQLVILTGTSAGGIGTFMNLDIFAQTVTWAKVLGIPDAGFFLTVDPYITGNCSTYEWCPIPSAMQRGVVTWSVTTPPQSCRYSGDQRYLCYFAYNLFPMKTPALVVHFIYDAAQFALLGVYPPLDSDKIAYIEKVAKQIRKTLQGTHAAAYGPTCYNHGLLMNDKWNKLNVDGVSISTFIYNWVTKGGTNQAIDMCQSMNCNPTCSLITSSESNQDLYLENFFMK